MEEDWLRDSVEEAQVDDYFRGVVTSALWVRWWSRMLAWARMNRARWIAWHRSA
jgi:hypothetical protein